MDPVTLAVSRIQFALSVGVHFLFPATSLGIALFIVIFEVAYVRTGDELYKKLSKLAIKLFGLVFALGVATGLLLPFLFGTNWGGFVEFAGGVFGIQLTLEAVIAFMIESIFLGVLLFGRDRVSKGVYLFSAVAVFIGAHISGFFIVSANSWMQTPFHSIENLAAGIPVSGVDGFILQQTLADGSIRQVTSAAQMAEGGIIRVVMTDVLKILFNPTAVMRFLHTIVACWITGAVFFTGVSAYYILKKKHNRASRKIFSIAMIVGVITTVAQPFIGHEHIIQTKHWQPVKNAAMEGIFETTEGAALIATGWVDVENRKTYGIPIPYMLSLLEEWNFTARVEGLDEYLERGHTEDIEHLKYEPDIQLTFQSFHAMVAMGIFMIFIYWLALYVVRKKKWDAKPWVWKTMLVMVPMPYIAVTAGWFTAEAGRQPWIVFGLLKTEDALSHIPASYAIFALVILILIYISVIYILAKWLPRLIRDGLAEYVEGTDPAPDETSETQGAGDDAAQEAGGNSAAEENPTPKPAKKSGGKSPKAKPENKE